MSARLIERTLYWAHALLSARLIERTLSRTHAFRTIARFARKVVKWNFFTKWFSNVVYLLLGNSCKMATWENWHTRWRKGRPRVQPPQPRQQPGELKFQPRPRYLSPLSTHALYVSQCTVAILDALRHRLLRPLSASTASEDREESWYYCVVSQWLSHPMNSA